MKMVNMWQSGEIRCGGSLRVNSKEGVTWQKILIAIKRISTCYSTDILNKLQNSNQPSFDVILQNDRRGLLVALGLFDLRLSQLVRVLEILIRLF